ncbi:MAG TPA: ribonuclease HI [Candidatus Mediterraneibacter colneyensis]|uniref:Ribonuclease H n=2 Tax=Lachnospiraceae TaxID=186803 RepID=A0A9D2RHE0_9FIRM|nr:ribonuclease HI [Candidatus Egerieimonas intestinavium]HIX63882.1 ribonuclease HI [Candidatus Mediterraneibacter colneyensis]HJD43028.1 ribonuclease HI [Candidatus Mediterraneibacter quadrami]
MVNEKTLVYTDGACPGDPGPGRGGYGIIIRYSDEEGNVHEQECSQGYERTTHNRMELRAVIKALEMLEGSCEVELYSDSKYVVDNANNYLETWIKRGWKKADNKPVENTDLWKRFVEVKSLHSVSLNWVKGHNKNPLNERCDKLAVEAANGGNLIVDEGYIE